RYEIVNQGISAEKIARKWGFSRQQLDEFSLESHRRALTAIQNGVFDQEIAPAEVTDEDGNRRVFATDEGPRERTSLRAIANLDAVFEEDGKLTAGNSSEMRDGASAVVLRSREEACALA